MARPQRIDIDRALHLWLQGLSAREIGRRLDCTGQAIDYHAKKRGWPKRTVLMVSYQEIEEEGRR